MKTIVSPRGMIAIACAAAQLVAAYSLAHAQQDQPLASAAANQDAPPIPADQLDSLVAPIALYPDPLLAQTLAASTYPLEVIQLQQWIATNKYLKDQALADVVEMQPQLSLELHGEATASRVDSNAPLCRGNADYHTGLI